MTGNKRMANYELLRVLSMVMVVILHFLTRSDSLIELYLPVDAVRIVGTVLEVFCLVAVNVYVLLSGYFGVRGSFRPTKAVALLCQIWFYALLIPIALTLFGVKTQASQIGIHGLVEYLFPIETEHYWFATSYFMLYLLSPVLNIGARSMTKRQLQITLGGLLILFCGIKSISPIGFVTDRYGYDLIWFICVYLVAAYLGLYGSALLEKKGWMIYVGSCALSFLISVAAVPVNWYLKERTGWSALSYYATVPFHYNFVFCLTAALGLFYGFSKITIREGKGAELIRRLGALCFGVYLLHEHIDLRGAWYGWLKDMINPAGREGLLWFVIELVACTVILFVAGIVIDSIRSVLFACIGRILSKSGIGRFFEKLDLSCGEGGSPQ